MDLSRLKQETASDHEAVEGLLPLMSPDLDTTQYIAYLQQMYLIVAAWEDAARRAAPSWLLPILAARSRLSLLDRDLAFFHASAPAPDNDTALPNLSTLPSLLGAMYVMEGSTLGGQYIARHLEQKFALVPGQGNAYFLGYGDRTGSMWKEFCLMLESTVPDAEAPTTIAAAKAMFAAFGACMLKLPTHG